MRNDQSRLIDSVVSGTLDLEENADATEESQSLSLGTCPPFLSRSLVRKRPTAICGGFRNRKIPYQKINSLGQEIQRKRENSRKKRELHEKTQQTVVLVVTLKGWAA